MQEFNFDISTKTYFGNFGMISDVIILCIRLQSSFRIFLI